MQSTTLHAYLPAPLPQPPSAGHRLAAYFLQPWSFLQRPTPDPRRVARLAETALQQPALRHWLLIIASESPRVRRALLTRAAHELQSHPAATAALAELADAPLLHAVTESLFRQTGLEPLAPAHRTGRGARVRLSELAERLQAQEAALLAA